MGGDGWGAVGRVAGGKVEEGVADKESGKGVVGGTGREADGGRDQGRVVEGEGEPGGVQEGKWRQ